MGKPPATQSKSRKDGFFTNKKHGNPRSNQSPRPFRQNFNQSGQDKPFSKESSAGSGSFFVSPTEKQQLLQEKEARKNANQKVKFERRNNAKPDDKSAGEKPKKVFDKKKWRLQKYSKKYKLEQWEEKRKKAVLHQYYKQINDDEPKFDVQKIYEQYKDEDEDGDGEGQSGNKPEETENENNLNKDIIEETSNITETEPSKLEPQASTSQVRKKKAFKKAHLEYQRIQDEKRERKVELERKKAEMAEALKEYKQKKLEKYRKLNKKTKKGQPIMKYRMEMLLERIQKSVQ